MKRILIVGALAASLMVPGVAAAQNDTNAIDTSYGSPPPEDDNDFPWGLLGLLGLLGLIPRKRKVDHVNVDNRTQR